MIKTLTPIVALCLLILTSCNFNSTYTNRASDKEEAKIIGDQYYANLKDSDYTAAMKLMSDRFWQASSKEKTLEMYEAVFKKLGKMKSINLDHWETRVVTGTNPSSEYILYYLNTYEKYEAKETLRLEKEGDKIKIVAFNVSSEGLLK